jgi:hypothetical protein
MIRAAALVALACCLVACVWVAGCAAPGDPVARHPVVPAAIADLAVRQTGNALALTFTLPTRSMDHENLPEHPSLEIFRAMLAPGAAPDKKTEWRLAYSVPSAQVDAYLQGERVEVHDTLAAEDFVRPGGASVAYKIRTRVVTARASADSNVVTARIYPVPEAPQGVHIGVTESALNVSWAAAAAPDGAVRHGYRVYRGVLESGQESAAQDVSHARLKSPLELDGTSNSTEYRDEHFEFGVTYLYTVRSVAQFGDALVESADSPPVAVTPRDIFPPAAPLNVEVSVTPATQQAAASVELSWAISPETDLAGYFVYRSDAEEQPGERISTDMLPSPTFRDISVLPGRRYFYRVSAVDRAGNESPRSAAVQADVP